MVFFLVLATATDTAIATSTAATAVLVPLQFTGVLLVYTPEYSIARELCIYYIAEQLLYILRCRRTV